MDLQSDAYGLFGAIGRPEDAGLWHYLPVPPFETAEAMMGFFRAQAERDGWRPYVFRRPEDGRAVGTATYMRVRPEQGSAEIGFVVFSEAMKRTAMATEAMYLMARHLFDDLGYRRYEWKCDAGNAASQRAARRLGFTFEGTFRQDMVVKGRNRDTAWFSILDTEWPLAKTAFEAWLSPDNFRPDGTQKRGLAEIREAIAART